ncbi:MAG: hypothetical protein WAR37_03425 [Candidatus Microsaccharimonas sp.]
MSNHFSKPGSHEPDFYEPEIRESILTVEDLLGEQAIPDVYPNEPDFSDTLDTVEPIEPVSCEEEELAIIYKSAIKVAEEDLERAHNTLNLVNDAFVRSVSNLLGQQVKIGTSEHAEDPPIGGDNLTSDSIEPEAIEEELDRDDLPSAEITPTEDDPFHFPETNRTKKKGDGIF